MGSYHPIRPSRLNSGCLFLLLFLGEFCSFLNLGQKMRGFLISILINQLKNSLAPRDLQYQIQSSDCHIAAQIVFMSLYSSQKHRQQINNPSTPPVTTWKKNVSWKFDFWPKCVLCSTPVHEDQNVWGKWPKPAEKSTFGWTLGLRTLYPRHLSCPKPSVQ